MKLELVVDEVDLPWVPPAEWTTRVEGLLGRVAAGAGRPAVLQVVLTDDATLREHNREYRGVDAPTDVLSFSYLEGHEERADALVDGSVPIEEFLDGPWPEDEDPVVGQVLVSLETLERTGPVHTGDREAELAFMVVHGMLHVLGHDHAEREQTERMRRHERALMDGIGVTLAFAVDDGPEGESS